MRECARGTERRALALWRAHGLEILVILLACEAVTPERLPQKARELLAPRGVHHLEDARVDAHEGREEVHLPAGHRLTACMHGPAAISVVICEQH